MWSLPLPPPGPIQPEEPKAWRLPGSLARLGVSALAVAGAFFVLRAITPSPAEDLAGRCIRLIPDNNKFVNVGCDEQHNGKVVLVVKEGQRCPAATVPLVLSKDKSHTLCVDPKL